MSFLVPSATYGTRMGRREYVDKSAFLLCTVMRRVTWWHCQIGLGIIVGLNRSFKVHKVNQTTSNKLILSWLWVANLLDQNLNIEITFEIGCKINQFHLLCFPLLPQSIIRGSQVHVNCFPVLVSYQATTGTIGQEGPIPCQPGISGPDYPSNWTKITSNNNSWMALKPWSNQIFFTTPWAPFTHAQVWRGSPFLIIQIFV